MGVPRPAAVFGLELGRVVGVFWWTGLLLWFPESAHCDRFMKVTSVLPSDALPCILGQFQLAPLLHPKPHVACGALCTTHPECTLFCLADLECTLSTARITTNFNFPTPASDSLTYSACYSSWALPDDLGRYANSFSSSVPIPIGLPESAMDGYYCKSKKIGCFATPETVTPIDWVVELDVPRKVTNIRVQMRRFGILNAFTDVEIRVGNDSTLNSNELFGTYSLKPLHAVVNFTNEIVGRYVQIRQFNRKVLSLCEVQLT